MKILLSVIIFFFMSIQSTAIAADLDPQKEQIANEIFADIFSPFCPGRALRDCPSSKASELRDSVRSRLAKGEDKDAIIESLLSVYGEELRALPSTSGFGAVAWLGPVIFLFLGGLIISWWLARKRGQAEPGLEAAPIDAALKKRIDIELGN